MNGAHLHLVINHVPVLGTIFGLALLAFAVWRGSDELKKAALGTFVISALLTVPTYLTGDPAWDVVSALPGVSDSVFHQHDDAAGVAFTGSAIVGVLALGGLSWFRDGKPVKKWFSALMLAGAVAVAGLMIWTANLGGQIRHTEIRSHNVPETSR
jgi:uncharacterized membrane protein